MWRGAVNASLFVAVVFGWGMLAGSEARGGEERQAVRATEFLDYHPNAPGLEDNKTWKAADPGPECRVDGLYGEYGRTWGGHYAGYAAAELARLPRVTTETGALVEGAVTALEVYDPTAGTEPVAKEGKVAAVRLALSDHPLVVAIPGAGGQD